MKKSTLIIASMFAIGSLFAQVSKNTDKSGFITCSEFHITKPLSEIFANSAGDAVPKYGEKESEDREHNIPQKFPNVEKDPLHYGNDPNSMQTTMGTVPNKAPIMNFAGQTASGFYPLDPTGAAGPTHYVQMINSTTFKIYNKGTGATLLTGTLGNLWSPATPNDGDPIVLYDKAADRWFLAQFGSTGNKIYIAISTTNNPTGSYYTYTFTSPQFPDYLKFSVWQDGYYMTSNQTQKVFAFDRTQMLAGNPASRSVYQTFSPPDGGYFFVPLPGDTGDGAMAPAGTPCPIFSYSDNGWGAGFSDAINIFKVTLNWVPATPTATIAAAGVIPTAAFDASYDPSWNDCPQPGTTQKLDGIGGVLMFRAQWKSWSGYNSVVLNWGVKISATQRSIKWCELRQSQSTGVWSLYQEGIYTPDANTRWLGSIAMDNNGSIALCYMKSNSSSIYPGLYYTGRRTCDPLGTLPVTEAVAIAGSGSQTGINRDGDYAETWLDPDGVTFWHTALYMGAGGAAQTRIYSFQIAPCAVAPPVANFSGTPTTVCAGQSVTYTDLSTNTPTSWAWTFAGGTPATSTVQNPVVVYNTPGNYSVTLTATNAAGSSAPVTMTNYITVNAIPATPTATNTGPYCAGSTITLATPTVAGATYSWTGPSAYSSAVQNPTRPAATVAMAGTYSVTETVAGCTSAAGTTTVVVNAIPATPTASNTGPYCAGSTITLSTPTVAGATYSWTGPGAYSSAVQNPTRPAATVAMAGTYSVTVTVSGCTSLAGTTTVVVNAIPATPVATNTGPYCAGSTITLATPTVAGATYSWTGPGAYSSAVQNPTRPAATVAMAGTYSVTITVSGCTSLAGTTTVVVNPTPATPTASNTGPYCAGSTITLSTPTVAGATYSWTGPSAYSSAVQNPTRPAATVAMSGTYSVTVTSGGCTSAAGTTTVVVNAVPATPTATNTGPYCAGSTITLATPTVAGATYSWTGPGAYSSAVQNPTRPAATVAMAGTYSVTVTVGGCTSLAGTTTVVVNPIPATPVATNTGPYCAGSTITLATPTAAGATYAWTGPSAYSSAVQNPTRPASTVAMSGTYSVTITVSGCTSLAGTTTVVVNATPTVTVPANITVCDSANVATTAFTSSPAGGTFAWTNSNTAIGLGASGVGNVPAFTATNPGAAPISGTITVTTTVSGCTSVATTYTITVNPRPATPTITQVGLVLTSSSATGNQWYLNGGLIAGATSQNYTVVSNGTYTVVVTSAAGCSSAVSAPVVITTVGITESANDPYNLLVYPNPNDGNFTISFNSKDKSTYRVEIVNALGQLVYREDVKDFSGTYSKQMSVVEYGQGVYTISLINSKNESVKKVIVY